MLMIATLYMSLVAIPYVCPDKVPINVNVIGPLTLGENVSAIKGRYPYFSEAFEDDGDGGIRYTVSICGNVDVEATSAGKEKIISMLRATSSVFITVEGAWVGMNVAELKRRYPGGKTNVLEGEGYIANFETGTGVYFGLDQRAIPRRCYKYRVDCDSVLMDVSTVDVFIQTN